MDVLTPKQNRILKFIEGFVHKNHRSPSLRDIGQHFRIAPGTAQDQVVALEKKGYLKREEFCARGLSIANSFHRIPIVGRVFAGNLHTAFENVEGFISYESNKENQNIFALRVRGDSMIEAGIYDGDMVIVRPQPTATFGDIVVARVEDETTIKYYRPRGRTIILEPANSAYQPINNPHIALIGKVIEVRRRYE